MLHTWSDSGSRGGTLIRIETPNAGATLTRSQASPLLTYSWFRIGLDLLHRTFEEQRGFHNDGCNPNNQNEYVDDRVRRYLFGLSSRRLSLVVIHLPIHDTS